MIHRKGKTLSRDEQKIEFSNMVDLRGGNFCKHCNDLGYTGWDEENQFYVPCECLMKAARKLEIGEIKIIGNKVRKK